MTTLKMDKVIQGIKEFMHLYYVYLVIFFFEHVLLKFTVYLSFIRFLLRIFPVFRMGGEGKTRTGIRIPSSSDWFHILGCSEGTKDLRNPQISQPTVPGERIHVTKLIPNSVKHLQAVKL